MIIFLFIVKMKDSWKEKYDEEAAEADEKKKTIC